MSNVNTDPRIAAKHFFEEEPILIDGERVWFQTEDNDWIPARVKCQTRSKEYTEYDEYSILIEKEGDLEQIITTSNFLRVFDDDKIKHEISMMLLTNSQDARMKVCDKFKITEEILLELMPKY